ncbi:MAG: PDZ domain-containing protein [Oscillospiraceae bacterium]|nr:PDZ domain-containing protein [Oscillospiraceae bacterium]
MKKLPAFFSFLLIFFLSVSASAARYLVPGGQVIGMELLDSTVTVSAFDPELGEQAKEAGLREGDRILRIDDTQVSCTADVKTALRQAKGAVRLSLLRNGKAKQLTLTPVMTEAGPRLGVYLKQGTTGVGTVTYYDPETQAFAALGHGVNTKNGELLRLTSGSVFPARIQAIKKGTIGTPGQLIGALTDTTPLGDIQKNTKQGVFGCFTAPAQIADSQPLPTAETHQIHAGQAQIISTITDGDKQTYSVEILKVYPNTDRTRNLLLKVTDPALLEATGGIVQGMSGSPIIQDGKLVGAVTHVLVNDPTTGYGIFIENMLDAAA